MNRILALAAIAVIGAFGVFLWSGNQPEAPGMTLGAVSAQTAEDIDTSIVTEMTLGNPDAPVTVVEYASFTCPHCRDFHDTGFKELKADYIDTGKINFIYREVYFDRPGMWAGLLARCGGEERYFGIVDMIYGNQRSWVSDDPSAVAGNLARMGRTAGLSDEQINTCLQDADLLQAMVAVYQKNATADGIQSTPSFLVNGELLSGNRWGDLKAMIDAALGS